MSRPLIQTTLSFKPLNADDARNQRASIAANYVVPSRPSAPTKRPVGRPKRPLDASAILLAAAESDKQSIPAQKKQKIRGEYTNWFDTEFISDIIAMYRACQGSARRAVQRLQLLSPDPQRYARLSHSTIASWFDDSMKLLPRFQEQLEAQQSARRNNGRPRVFDQYPSTEEAIKETLVQMRQAGAPMNSHIIRWVIEAHSPPSLLKQLKLSQQYISSWARTTLKWSWRHKTTAASKLPNDWEEQGITMAMRIAATMQRHSVHPSLIINMDQTGVNLVPVSHWTYDTLGAASVAIVGAEDKRQITVCLASALDGSLLPLQLIFEGLTPRSIPPHTDASTAAEFHFTNSTNHWSSQATMQQFVTNVIMPHAERSIRQHKLDADAKVILVLDAWSVHRSEEFRTFLRSKHPRIHLVFVPANCTSKLQVADVALQRPFKHGVKKQFNQWAAEQIKRQVEAKSIQGVNHLLTMKILKPLIVDWCVKSWQSLKSRPNLIIDGWNKCVTKLFNVNSHEKRNEALNLVFDRKLDISHVPDEIEQGDALWDSDQSESSWSASSSDEEHDQLDTTQERRFGTRRSSRASQQSSSFGYTIDSSMLAMTSDSDACTTAFNSLDVQ